MGHCIRQEEVGDAEDEIDGWQLNAPHALRKLLGRPTHPGRKGKNGNSRSNEQEHMLVGREPFEQIAMGMNTRSQFMGKLQRCSYLSESSV